MLFVIQIFYIPQFYGSHCSWELEVGSWKLEVGSWELQGSMFDSQQTLLTYRRKHKKYVIFLFFTEINFVNSLPYLSKTKPQVTFMKNQNHNWKISIFRLCKKLYYPKVCVRNCSFLNVKLQFPTDWIPEKWANSSQDNTKRNFALVQHVHWICKVLADFIYWVLLV